MPRMSRIPRFSTAEDSGIGGIRGFCDRPCRFRRDRQAVTMTVRSKPVRAGVDPHHMLGWEKGEDDGNVLRMETGSR